MAKLEDNPGVKAGVLVPEVDVNRISVPKFEPSEVLAEVCHFAKTVSVGNKRHLATLKCRLSAFYRSKGYKLPLYNEPVYIEGLDGEKQNLRPAVNGFNPFSSDDNNIRRRKIKTLAELMGENAKVEPKKTRKRKVESLENVSEESVETGPISRKAETEVAVDEDLSVETKQELDNVFTPRERKQSKYLMHPYTTSLIGMIGKSSSIPKCVNNASEEHLPDEKLNTKMPFPLSDVEMPVNELLAKIQLAAVKPLYFSNKGSINQVSAFVSAVRSSTYLHGSNHKIYQKSVAGQKQKKSQKKSLRSQPKPSSVVGKTPKMVTSCDTDDFISDVIYATRKLELMTVTLEKYHTAFSVEEKASLKEDIKQVMESVDNVSEKVETASEKYDVYGNQLGLLGAHPVAPLVSLHHLDVVDPIFPRLTRVDGLKRLFQVCGAGFRQYNSRKDSGRFPCHGSMWCK